jgi:hemoglobin
VAAVAEKTLFDRLGGMAAIEAEIDDFLGNVLADDRINKRFAETDAADLRQKLIDQVCEAAGGPCKYTGEDMVEAHKDMNVTDAEFDALVEDLVRSLDAKGVGSSEKNELLGVLGPMRSDIVGK